MAFLLGGKIPFDQSNTLLASFFISIGAWVLLLNSCFKLLIKKKIHLFAQRSKRIIFFTLLLVLIALFCGLSIGLKYYLLIESISLDFLIIYEFCMIIILSFLVALIFISPDLLSSLKLIQTQASPSEPSIDNKLLIQKDHRFWFLWIILLIALGEFLGIRTLTNSDFFANFSNIGILGGISFGIFIVILIFLINNFLKNYNINLTNQGGN
jgi:hypothetical protein